LPSKQNVLHYSVSEMDNLRTVIAQSLVNLIKTKEKVYFASVNEAVFEGK